VGPEVEGFILLGEGAVFVGREGVVDAQAMGVGGAVFFGDDVVGSLHAGDAGLGVVGVGGDEVDPAVGEQAVGHALGGFAHLAGHGVGGDLGKEADTHPLDQAPGIALQGWVALGVGEDGAHAGEAELVEGFIEVEREAVVGELGEQVLAAVDGELVRVGDGVLQVVVGHVEVATGAEDKGDGFGGEGAAQLGEAAGVAFGVEVVDVVGVGCDDDVGDAVCDRDAGHGDRGFEVGRAVVQLGQQMVVEVDHKAMGTVTLQGSRVKGPGFRVQGLGSRA